MAATLDDIYTEVRAMLLGLFSCEVVRIQQQRTVAQTAVRGDEHPERNRCRHERTRLCRGR